MPVDVQELTSTIEAEPETAQPPSGATASSEDAACEHRERMRRLQRDALRTRAEGYDD
jgi:hypothetical protein